VGYEVENIQLCLVGTGELGIFESQTFGGYDTDDHALYGHFPETTVSITDRNRFNSKVRTRTD
jgi:hypothetical protein